ncbi:uncharacterized protein LOC119078504 [Bradysia coprophila]|uniref:uncharacterized protein LOC119078504 n=1 Tax=Bradysia coprophila TaxID=38358 RepID=UPI00187DD247|nr:uncharacterized protein LOC119078504 [Bradysia coprophila]
MPKLKNKSYAKKIKEKAVSMRKVRNKLINEENSLDNSDNSASSTRNDIVDTTLMKKTVTEVDFKGYNHFYKIILGDFSQFSSEFKLPHHQCTAMAALALATATFKPVISWNSRDLNSILREGQTYYEKCILYQFDLNSKYNDTFLEAIHLLPNVELSLRKIDMFVNLTECRGGRLVKDFFVDAVHNFESCQFTYGIITCKEQSYGLIRLQNVDGSSHYAFFDSHGRTLNGNSNGSKSAIIFFENATHFINFFLKENQSILQSNIVKNNEDAVKVILVPLHFIDMTENESNNSLYQPTLSNALKVISGSFAQNDIRFNKNSRNKQCTANSVLFLAFITILKHKISSVDLDSILMIGDQIYAVSYNEAVKVRSQKPTLTKSQITNPHLAADEIEKQIFVDIDRFKLKKFKLSSQPLSDKEYSGNFNKFAKVYIERFFKDYDSGIFICSSLSIALHRMCGEYVVFDPHARSAKGLPQNDGTSNIFFFPNIKSLYEYLRRSGGYDINHEFTLTPFIIEHGYKVQNSHISTESDYVTNTRITLKRKSTENSNDQLIKRIKLSNKTREHNKCRIQKYRLNMSVTEKEETKKKNSDQKKQKRVKNNMKIPYEWPSPIDQTIKKKCLENFLDKMSKKEILQKTCSICNRVGFNKDFKQVKFSDIKNRELLQSNQQLPHIPGLQVLSKEIKQTNEKNEEAPEKYATYGIQENIFNSIPGVIICKESSDTTVINKKLSTYKESVYMKNLLQGKNTNDNTEIKNKDFTYFCYKNTILYKTGIDLKNCSMTDDSLCNICSKCITSLNRKIPTTPDFSPANDSFIGDVPEVLQNLTIPEEQLISLYRHNKCIIKIQARTYDASTKQSKISGNVIVFEQNISSIAKTLPFTEDSLCDSIKIIFVGSNPPSKKWLIENNPLYKDIKLSEKNLNSLPNDDIPDSLWITMDSSTNVHASNSCRSGYANENLDNTESMNDSKFNTINHESDSNETDEIGETLISLSSSALIDVDGIDTSTGDIQDHILNNTFPEKQVNTTDNTYYMIPRSEKLVNQYDNHLLLLGLFPTLFPYGLGGPDNPDRKNKTSYKMHIQYLLSYQDKRFERHHSFIFVVFNILQRRNACYTAKLMMNQPYSQSYAQQISNVKSTDVEEALKIISEKNKNTTFKVNPDVNRLVKQVKAVGGNVQGSVQARSKLRVNLHSLIYNKGLPHIFLTINPADTCNPISLYICGVDIDFENVFNKFPSGYVRSQITASHPVSTATFFNYLIENIISALIMGGVLGPMDSYFGPVESQGRGSLHVHMLLWLLHKLRPKDMMEKIADPEFRKKFNKILGRYC